MARNNNISEVVTQTELITIAYDYYDKNIAEMEARKTGAPEEDAIIEHFLEMPRKKREILKLMYKLQTGNELFED